MNTLSPEIARHLFPITIYPMIVHAGLIDKPWEFISKIQGSWMSAYGIDGLVNRNKDNKVSSIGRHIAFVYNDPIEMVVHRASSSVRLRIKENGYVSKVAVGPHCCAKFAPVRQFIADGVLKSEKIEYNTGRTETTFFDEAGRIERFKNGPMSYTFSYSDKAIGPVSMYNVAQNKTTDYVLDPVTAFPISLNIGENEITKYEIIRETKIDRYGRVLAIQAGATRLLDFTDLWKAFDAGEFPEFKEEFEERWGEKTWS